MVKDIPARVVVSFVWLFLVLESLCITCTAVAFALVLVLSAVAVVIRGLGIRV